MNKNTHPSPLTPHPSTLFSHDRQARNQRLLDRARRLVQRLRSGSRDEETLLEMIEDYETACSLARGPIPERARQWKQNAINRGRALAVQMDLIGEKYRKK